MRLAACSVLLLLLGCPAAEYEIGVQLRTDFVPGVDFVATRAELFRQPPGATSIAVEAIERPAFGTFSLGVEIGAWDVAPGEYYVRGQLLTTDGVILGEAVGHADVRARTLVPLTITRSCRSTRCETGLTCMAGFCVSLSCEPGECASECSSDGECVGTASCAAGRCDDGACWFDVEMGCPAGEYCDPDLGCIERPDAGIALDAGARDSGSRDGGFDSGGAGIDAGPPPCLPDCYDHTCGLDPACGTYDCGTCTATQTCSGGTCVETSADCSGLACGPARNGVGGPDACGTCGAGFGCVDGACACGGQGASCVSGSCCSPLACTGGACCTPVGMACGSASECCPTRACQMGLCCVVVGDGCSSPTQCCNGHNCSGGRCCVRIGVGCSSDDQCCTNDCYMGACR